MTKNGDLVPFVFPDTNRPVRFVMKDGLAWPVLADVCRELGITNASNVSARLPNDTLHSMEGVVGDDGRPRSLIVIHPHRGLPRVIIGSRSKQKDRLESWIFDEVLPQIFETGGYSLSRDPVDRELEMTRRHLVALQELKASRQALAVALPKIETYDAIVADESWYSASEVAKSHFGHLRLGRNGLEGALAGRFIFRDSCDGAAA